MAKKEYIPLHQLTSDAMRVNEDYPEPKLRMFEWAILVSLLLALILF